MAESPVLQQIINQKITKVWRGYAGVIFFELGTLSKELKHSSKGDWFSEKGEFSIMVEGYWQLEKENKEILNITKSTYRDIDETLKQLTGLELKSIAFDESTQNFNFYITNNFLFKTKNFDERELVIFRKGKTIFSHGEDFAKNDPKQSNS